MEIIEKLQEQQREAAMELTLKLGLLHYVVEELTEAGVSEETAVRSTLQCVKAQIIEFFREPDGQYTVRNMSQLINQILCQINAVRDLAAATAAVSTTPLTLGQLAKETTSALSEAASKIGVVTANEINRLRLLMRTAGQAITTSTCKTVFKGIGIAAGIIFTVVDITLLIRHWSNPHPLCLSIQKIVDDLVHDTFRCIDTLSVLKRLENEPVPSPSVSI